MRRHLEMCEHSSFLIIGANINRPSDFFDRELRMILKRNDVKTCEHLTFSTIAQHYV